MDQRECSMKVSVPLKLKIQLYGWLLRRRVQKRWRYVWSRCSRCARRCVFRNEKAQIKELATQLAKNAFS